MSNGFTHLTLDREGLRNTTCAFCRCFATSIFATSRMLVVGSGREGEAMRDFSVACLVIAIAIASLSVNLFLEERTRPSDWYY